MSRSVAYPFLTLPDQAVTVHAWMVGDPGQPLSRAPAFLPHWDYARDLEVRVELSIDREVAAANLGIAGNPALRCVLDAGTGAGRVPRRRMTVAETVVDSDGRMAIGGVLDGRQLSGRLQLSLDIILDAVGAQLSPLAPRLKASRLWHASTDVLLEAGDSSRFPVEAASFARLFAGRPHVEAPWFVHFRSGAFDADFLAAVRLFVNKDCADHFARFVEGDTLILQMMVFDVAFQLCADAITRADADELAGCEPGSVGYQVKAWLQLALPGMGWASVCTLFHRDPAVFRASLLAACDCGEAA